MIGWSLCRKTEPFSKIVGLRYALERAIPLEELKEQPLCVAALKGRLDKAIAEHNATRLACDTYSVDAANLKEELEELLAKQPPHSIRETLNRFIERIMK